MKGPDTTLIELQNALLAVLDKPGEHITVTRVLMHNAVNYIRELKAEIKRIKNKK